VGEYGMHSALCLVLPSVICTDGVPGDFDEGSPQLATFSNKNYSWNAPPHFFVNAHSKGFSIYVYRKCGI